MRVCETGTVSNVPAAGHALAVLQLLARHAEPLPAASIARDLGLPRSSVYHLLAALRDREFVVHLPEERRYGLGVAAFELGSAYTRQAPLQRVARPVLARLVDQVKQNGHFAVLHGRDVFYVIEERAIGRPPLVTDVGVRLPSHLAASGLAMLSALPAPQVRALYPSREMFVQRHGVGATSLPELRSVLAGVRQTGYAEEEGAISPDFSSVGVPVLDRNDHPVGAIALTFPSDLVAAEGRVALAHAAQSAAREVSRRMGSRA